MEQFPEVKYLYSVSSQPHMYLLGWLAKYTG